jgi:RNA-directed DNA polymerase
MKYSPQESSRGSGTEAPMHITGGGSYVRYADDFVLMARNKELLEKAVKPISRFLEQCLLLSLHPNKVSIQTISSGVDFLGWVHFPKHRVLRTTTKRRMHRRIHENPQPETLASYLGLMKHGNTERLKAEIINNNGLWRRTM